MKKPEPFAAIIFGTAYNVCPRYPAGTKWEVGMRSRYASCAWNMETFSDALAYLREQYAHAVASTKNPRRGGDEYCEREFWGWIDGPGGRMNWATIEALVKRAK